MDSATFEGKRDELLNEFLHSFNAITRQTSDWKDLKEFMTKLEFFADPAAISDKDVQKHLAEIERQMELERQLQEYADENDNCHCR